MRDRSDDPDSVATDAATDALQAVMRPGDEVPPGAPASGEHLCRTCRGAGRAADGPPSPDCDGTGHVTVAISAGP